MISGGCLCSAVRYRLSSQPFGSMICHCRTCQKASGAPVTAALSVHVNEFHIIKGTPASFASSPKVTRGFCNLCGTQLTYRHMDDPEEVCVATMTLDDPEVFPPSHHSWVSHDPKWLKFGDDLPQFAQSRYSNPEV